MADDWEQEDWEAEDFKPSLPAGGAAAAAPAQEFETAGQAILARVAEVDMSKFADEDQEEEEEPVSYHIKPQPKKKVEKKYASKGETVDDTPLDDPEAERLRKQRLEEESDFRAIADMFGGERASMVKQLDSMLPKSVKDFEEAAELLAKLFITPHATNKNYKAFVKALLRVSADPLNSDDAKEIENTAGTLRADKVKAEKAAAAAKKGSKKSINVGRGGGTAGLDDYVYDDAVDDGYDFM
ncbi:hypothetical protein OEZ86_007317 [Tetradesmus obliquus]|uniref:Uncharacterized protein n=2 Tax=Tetradesmus obliquus TaxID=3088 RepID=A0ABY8UR78_TETOB|nr:hypothetical protein OEZ85_013712 [Tetradesmus obliquus]WIA44598.1 hypothetical protein OEZ86_007317 [Tetradesmus obliquus]|eukprot:jgi/Sobl393_1/6785/SZX62237.1